MRTANHVKIAASAVVLALTICVIAFGQLTEDESKELWSKLREASANPEKNVFDRWAVVERIPLVKEVDGIPMEYAAAAAVLLHYAKNILRSGIYFSNDDNVSHHIVVLSNEFGRSWRERDKAICSYLERLESEQKQLDVLGKKLSNYPTGVPNGKSLAHFLYSQRHGKGEGQLEATIRQFYVDRLYETNIRRQAGDWEAASSLLDNGIPFLLTGGRFGDSTVVCVGYFVAADNKYVVVADPLEVEIAAKSHAYALVDPPREDEREEIRIIREKLRGFDDKFGMFQEDIQFRIETAEGKKGIILMEWPVECEMFVIPVPRPSDYLVREFLKGVQ